MPPELLTRRRALAWLLRAGLVVGAPAALLQACGGERTTGTSDVGYGRDPDLMHPATPWPLSLKVSDRETAARLADLLLPGDEHGPAPSEIGIAAFIDEWLSAPYPEQRADREVVVPGLRWLDDSAPPGFARADPHVVQDVVARIARVDDGRHDFFLRFRRMCLLGYYTSESGMKDIGHVVPAPASSFTGPPPAVLARLGEA